MSKDKLTEDKGFQASKFPDLRVLYPEELHILYSSAKHLSYEPNEVVIQEGKASDYLYLVDQGQLRVNKKHEDYVCEVGAINPGDIFGEASLLYQTTAGAEVRAMDHCELYAIPAESVLEVFNSNERFLRATTQLAENRAAASALAVNPVFMTLPLAVREVVLYNAKFVSVREGEVIIHAGDQASFTFLLLAGQVDVSIPHPNHVGEMISVSKQHSGDEIGEIALLTGLAHMGTVTAETPVRLLAVRNMCMEAWAERYSDFAYSIYVQVQKKLKSNRHLLNDFVEDRAARELTTNLLPSLEDFKLRYHL